jgi:uncharacterized protein (DUF58 family)
MPAADPSLLPESLGLLPADLPGLLRRLEWRARKRLRGNLSGRHTSPEKGASVEFAEHRPYAPGDDPRTLDWRVMARNDRNVVKQFIEETNLRATLVLDLSGSMAYAGELAAPVDGRVPAKFDYGRRLAAALAWLFVKQGDAAGLVTFDRAIREEIRAGRRPSQVRRILDVLWAAAPGGDTRLAEVLHEVAERIPRRGLVMIISDFLDDADRLAGALHHFDCRRHELVLFHVLAGEEQSFPFKAYQRFRDLEGVAPMLRIDPRAVRAAYLERMQAFIRQLEATCGRLRADYVPVSTTVPLRETLLRYFGRRHARG